jgi:hypothetical protein
MAQDPSNTVQPSNEQGRNLAKSGTSNLKKPGQPPAEAVKIDQQIADEHLENIFRNVSVLT